MLIVSIILLLLLIGLLVAPVSLHVHSLSKELYANVWNIFIAKVLFIQSELAIQFSLFSWKWVFYPFRRQGKERQKSPKKRSSGKKKWGRASFLTVDRLKKILSSFKVREFDLDIDTRDVVWNAYLYPVSVFLLHRGYPIRVNYQNHFHLDLVIENRLGSLLKALIVSYI